MQNRIEFFFFSLLLFLIRLFPFRTVQRMGGAFGSFMYSVIGIRKQLVLDNLIHAFPEKSPEEIHDIALASYKNLFTAYFEILYLDKLSEATIRSMISFPDADKMKEVMSRGKGVIILTGHYGNWELCALSVPLFVPQSYTIIVQNQRNPYVNNFMTCMRTRFGTKLLVMERALRESLRALSNNEGVALIADQSGPESGIYVEFFGRQASTHQGPAVFQARTGAPMIMLMLVREGPEKFRIDMEEIDTQHLGGTDAEKIELITRRHVKALERFIVNRPDHWLWMHKRWKHSPLKTGKGETGRITQ